MFNNVYILKQAHSQVINLLIKINYLFMTSVIDTILIAVNSEIDSFFSLLLVHSQWDQKDVHVRCINDNQIIIICIGGFDISTEQLSYQPKKVVMLSSQTGQVWYLAVKIVFHTRRKKITEISQRTNDPLVYGSFDK